MERAMFSKHVMDVVRGKPASAEAAELAADCGLVRIVSAEDAPNVRIHTPGGSFGIVPTPFGLERLALEVH